MPARVLTCLLGLLSVLSIAHAQSSQLSDPLRRMWAACQHGHLDSCNRLLRLPIDGDTRHLVEIDQALASERRSAYARILMDLCVGRVNARACDRALLYSPSAEHRAEILAVRKAVLNRKSSR